MSGRGRSLSGRSLGRFPEGLWDGFRKAFWAGYRKVFGTGTLPTGTSVASSRGEGRLLAGLRHSDLAYRYFSAIPAWRRGLLPALWHGDPFHRCLSGILAWQSILLTGLRHGDLQLKHFWGRVACRRKGNRYRCRAYGQVCDRVWHGTPGYR